MTLEPMDYSKVTIDEYKQMDIHQQLEYERWRDSERKKDAQERINTYWKDKRARKHER
jgi:hypothetical protein